MDVSIQVDTQQIVSALTEKARQIPFAVAASLTATAKGASGDVKAKLPQSFTLRGNWVPGGIRFKPATKASLTAVVGSRSDHMRVQAEGGALPGKAAIPTDLMRAGGKKLGRAQWPAALWRRRKSLQILAIRKRGEPDRPMTTVGGKVGLWQRVGRGRFPVRALYWLSRTQTLEQRWEFAEQVSDYVRARWAEFAADRLKKVLATSR